MIPVGPSGNVLGFYKISFVFCGSCRASWAVQCPSTAGHPFLLAKALGKLWLWEGCTCSCVTSGQLPSARSRVGCLCSASSALMTGSSMAQDIIQNIMDLMTRGFA